MITFNIDAGKIMDKLANKIIQKMQLAAEVLYEEIMLLSPTDTYEYILWNKIIPVIKKWNIIETWVINSSFHAYWVEYWFADWKDMALKWHKWPPRDDSTVIYRWVWASPYRRSVDNKQKEIINIIKW